MKMIFKTNRYFSKASKSFGINGNIFSRSNDMRTFSKFLNQNRSRCWSVRIYNSKNGDEL